MQSDQKWTLSVRTKETQAQDISQPVLIPGHQILTICLIQTHKVVDGLSRASTFKWFATGQFA